MYSSGLIIFFCLMVGLFFKVFEFNCIWNIFVFLQYFIYLFFVLIIIYYDFWYFKGVDFGKDEFFIGFMKVFYLKLLQIRKQ